MSVQYGQIHFFEGLNIFVVWLLAYYLSITAQVNHIHVRVCVMSIGAVVRLCEQNNDRR